jgi:hypothetical protein
VPEACVLTFHQALEVSGEAVQAQFEAWLRPRITSADYPGDVPRLIYQICRKFKEEKKDCGLPPRPGSTTWNIPAPRLRVNRDKGFEKGYMKIDRYKKRSSSTRCVLILVCQEIPRKMLRSCDRYS